MIKINATFFRKDGTPLFVNVISYSKKLVARNVLNGKINEGGNNAS